MAKLLIITEALMERAGAKELTYGYVKTITTKYNTMALYQVIDAFQELEGIDRPEPNPFVYDHDEWVHYIGWLNYHYQDDEPNPFVYDHNEWTHYIRRINNESVDIVFSDVTPTIRDNFKLIHADEDGKIHSEEAFIISSTDDYYGHLSAAVQSAKEDIKMSVNLKLIALDNAPTHNIKAATPAQIIYIKNYIHTYCKSRSVYEETEYYKNGEPRYAGNDPVTYCVRRETMDLINPFDLPEDKFVNYIRLNPEEAPKVSPYVYDRNEWVDYIKWINSPISRVCVNTKFYYTYNNIKYDGIIVDMKHTTTNIGSDNTYNETDMFVSSKGKPIILNQKATYIPALAGVYYSGWDLKEFGENPTSTIGVTQTWKHNAKFDFSYHIFWAEDRDSEKLSDLYKINSFTNYDYYEQLDFKIGDHLFYDDILPVSKLQELYNILNKYGVGNTQSELLSTLEYLNNKNIRVEIPIIDPAKINIENGSIYKVDCELPFTDGYYQCQKRLAHNIKCIKFDNYEPNPYVYDGAEWYKYFNLYEPIICLDIEYILDNLDTIKAVISRFSLYKIIIKVNFTHFIRKQIKELLIEETKYFNKKFNSKVEYKLKCKKCVFTSYFGCYDGHDMEGVSIARWTPRGWKGRCIPELAPSESLLSWWKKLTPEQQKDAECQRQYIEAYKDETLSELDVHDVYNKLKGKVLLCYEKPEDFCHRHIVADWLKEAGYPAEEWKDLSF